MDPHLHYRCIRGAQHLRFARPCLDPASYLPEGAAQPHQSQDYRRVLRTQGDEETDGGRQGGHEAGGEADRRRMKTKRHRLAVMDSFKAH